MDKELKLSIKQYINYDDHIKNMEEKLKGIKSKRKKLEGSIINRLKSNNIDGKIKIDNSSIKFTDSKIKQPVSLKLLKTELNKFYKTKYANLGENKCNKMSEEIFEYICKSRIVKTKSVLKRVIYK